jgi:hypothetical protein
LHQELRWIDVVRKARDDSLGDRVPLGVVGHDRVDHVKTRFGREAVAHGPTGDEVRTGGDDEHA